MGRIVEFPSNGKACHGYLALPGSPGPGLVVIQEWWGLVDHIKDVAERFAGEGFVALAPDLYHGTRTAEPDEAAKLMMDLKLEEAGRDLSGAVEYLRTHELVEPKKIGCVGFCMGGALSLTLATLEPLDACVAYYGIPSHEVDYSAVRGPVLIHVAEHDDWGSPDAIDKVVNALRASGKQAEQHIYPGTEHAFFNDDRPEVYNKEAALESWERTLAFFREHLR